MRASWARSAFAQLLLLVALAGVALHGCDGGGVSPPEEVADRARYEDRRFTIARVIDGDTAVLEDGTSVRYIGIDAPEARPVPQCGAAEATAANTRWVGGREVIVRLDPADTRDRFGRLLAYLEVDGSNVNVELVREGRACASPFGDTRRFRDRIAAAEAEARAARRGVWSGCPPVVEGCPPAG